MSSVDRIARKLEKDPIKVELVCIITLILIGLWAFSPMFFRSNLPGIADAPGHYFKTWFLKKSLEEYKEFPNWCPYWYGGYPIFHFYSPGGYLLIYFFNVITGLSLSKSFNTVFAISAIIEGILLYSMMRILNFSRLPSMLSGILLYSNPLFIKNIGHDGAITYHIGAIPALVSVTFLILAFKRKKMLYAVLSGIFFGLTVLCHQTTTFILFFPLFFIVSLVYIGFERNRNLLIIPITVIGIGFVISSYWWFPAVIHHSYYHPTHFKGVYEFSFSRLFEPGNLFYIGRIHVLLGILGLVYCMTKFKTKEMLILVIWGLLSFIIVLMTYPSYVFILYMFLNKLIYPLSMLGGVSLLWLSFIKDELTSKFSAFIVLSIIFVLLLSYFSSNHERLVEWEDISMTNPSPILQSFYEYFSMLPKGNTIVYGLPQWTSCSSIPVMSRKPYILGWYNEGSPHYSIYENYLYDELYTTNPESLYELYKQGGVRWVGVWLVFEDGYYVAKMARDKPNMFSFIMGGSLMAEKNYTFYIIEVVGSRQAYIVRNGGVTKEKVTVSQENPHKIILRTDASPPFKIYIAQSYFPYWKSSSGEITKTERGFMLVPGDNLVVLKYEQGIVSSITKILSLIGFCFSIYLLYLFKKNQELIDLS